VVDRYRGDGVDALAGGRCEVASPLRGGHRAFESMTTGFGPIARLESSGGRPPRERCRRRGGGQAPYRMIPKAVARLRAAVVLLRVTVKIVSGAAAAVPSIVTEKVLTVSPAAKVSSSVFAR